MRKNTRETIRRPKDWESDPAWDSDGKEVFTEGGRKPKTKTIEKDEVFEADRGKIPDCSQIHMHPPKRLGGFFMGRNRFHTGSRHSASLLGWEGSWCAIPVRMH